MARRRSACSALRANRSEKPGLCSNSDMRNTFHPTAMLRSTALLLRHGLARPEEADALTHAIDVALASTPTADLGGTATTADFGKKIREQLVAGGTPTVVR